MVFVNDLNNNEYAPFYRPYIEKAGELDLLRALKQGSENTESFFRSVPKGKLDFRYAEGKWTIKEILLHLIDAERVFAYRALRFSRNDKTPLMGFDENNYVPISEANTRSLESLMDEYLKQRVSTLAMYSNFTEEMLKRSGTASGQQMSVRAAGFVIVGHEKHHLEVIKERYL